MTKLKMTKLKMTKLKMDKTQDGQNSRWTKPKVAKLKIDNSRWTNPRQTKQNFLLLNLFVCIFLFAG